MTLNEKFDLATDGWIVADRCEKIADEFAIGFNDWVNVNAYKFPTEITTKELLEIYKKEIRL